MIANYCFRFRFHNPGGWYRNRDLSRVTGTVQLGALLPNEAVELLARKMYSKLLTSRAELEDLTLEAIRGSDGQWIKLEKSYGERR